MNCWPLADVEGGYWIVGRFVLFCFVHGWNGPSSAAVDGSMRKRADGFLFSVWLSGGIGGVGWKENTILGVRIVINCNGIPT